MEMDKNSLRIQMIKKRDFVLDKEILDQEIYNRMIKNEKFIKSKIIAIYIAKGSEVETKKIIEKAIELGKEVTVPITNVEIELYRFNSFDDLIRGKFGILEPKTRILPSREPDLVIIPGVAFGQCMHRLGYGKGYYDRFLSNSKSYRIGICYDFQIMEKLPSHEMDQKMDEIISEKRIVKADVKQNQSI